MVYLPSEKYESIGKDDIPYMESHKSHVPNHQPVIVFPIFPGDSDFALSPIFGPNMTIWVCLCEASQQWYEHSRILCRLTNFRVSWNRGTLKSSILIGFSIINHPLLGYPYFRKPPNMCLSILFIIQIQETEPLKPGGTVGSLRPRTPLAN